jgi:hypothetical protein
VDSLPMEACSDYFINLSAFPIKSYTRIMYYPSLSRHNLFEFLWLITAPLLIGLWKVNTVVWYIIVPESFQPLGYFLLVAGRGRRPTIYLTARQRGYLTASQRGRTDQSLSFCFAFINVTIRRVLPFVPWASHRYRFLCWILISRFPITRSIYVTLPLWARTRISSSTPTATLGHYIRPYSRTKVWERKDHACLLIFLFAHSVDEFHSNPR